MKFRVIAFIALFLFAGIAAVIAQEPGSLPPLPDWSNPSGLVGSLVDWYTFLYAGAIYLVAYLSPRIPVLSKIPNLAWMVLIVAVLLGLGFIFAGASFAKLILPFFMQINVYELVLKLLFGRTKKDAEPVPPNLDAKIDKTGGYN